MAIGLNANIQCLLSAEKQAPPTASIHRPSCVLGVLRIGLTHLDWIGLDWIGLDSCCLLYTSPSPRDSTSS
eukprot:7474441-Prorocentrum_lima.AAC.1